MVVAGTVVEEEDPALVLTRSPLVVAALLRRVARLVPRAIRAMMTIPLVAEDPAAATRRAMMSIAVAAVVVAVVVLLHHHHHHHHWEWMVPARDAISCRGHPNHNPIPINFGTADCYPNPDGLE